MTLVLGLRFVAIVPNDAAPESWRYHPLMKTSIGFTENGELVDWAHPTIILLAHFCAQTHRMLSLHKADFSVYLNGIDRDRFQQQLEQRQQYLERSRPSRLLLAVANPTDFLASFWAAIATDTPVFLGNPRWSQGEWQQVSQLVQPQQVWGDVPVERSPQLATHPLGTIMIPTGGSSGQIRFAMHTVATLRIAVDGFQAYFKVPQVNSFCILPLYHVSGLMQVWRSQLTGGQCMLGSYAALKRGEWPDLPFHGGFLSLVPTQLQQLLDIEGGEEWLRQFEVVLLGGAPAWPELLEDARTRQIRLAPTYGMTETAAQIATLKPQDFLAGHSSSGQVLPHAQVQIGEEGAIAIATQSLCLGYYPNPFPTQLFWPTDDRGQLDAQGYLTITGRQSRKIITGGENVFPEQIEAILRSTGQVQDVCVVGVPDAHWGETVAVAYVPNEDCDRAQLQTTLDAQCARWLHPRLWLVCDALPRSPQGKIQYAQVQAWFQQNEVQKNAIDTGLQRSGASI